MSKPSDLIIDLVSNYKDQNFHKVCKVIDLILSNKIPNVQKYFSSLDIDMQKKRLGLELESDYFYNLMEYEKILFRGYIEFLQKLLQYYVEREKAGNNIISEFEQFFESCGKLVGNPKIQIIFSFAVKQLVKEQNRIIKALKQNAKDEQAVKNAAQISKNLTPASIKVSSELLRQVNSKGAKELKLLVSNQQMKIHFMQFKFDRAANCDKLEKEGNLKEISPKADVITSYYYKGRINIFSSKFGDASTNLKQVLYHAPQNEKGFKVSKQVLKYLIPVSIFLGQFPSEQLIRHYELYEYTQLCQAVKQGNIKLLQEVIDKYRGLWIKRSLLILLDQLKVLTYRNLCKKVWLIEGKSNKIRLEKFLAAFEFSHPDNEKPEMAEVCCIIANLIYLRLISGRIYQNNETRALTLNKDPFQKIKPEEVDWKF